MQFEMAHPSCPLCKRQMPAHSLEHTLSTRLCEQCQTMVLTAFRGADSVVGASTAVAAQIDTPTHVLREDHTVVAPALFEEYPTEAPAFVDELPSSIPFEATDAVGFDFYKDDDPDERIHQVETDSSAFSGNGSFRHYELAEEYAEPTATTDHDHSETDESDLSGQTSVFSESAEGSFETEASLLEARNEEPAAIEEEAVADPWEAPLPAWDYSHSEWPVLVGPSKRRSFRKLGIAIAAVVLLAVATGFYFLISRPSTPARNTATDSGTTARVSEPRVAASASANSNPAAAAPQSTETAAREAASSNNIAQGRFSLQAAAFPTQGGADEFAEKLKRAGVPSYVVPADLARRGKWFRVRVGRFNSAEDAQRFAIEAQQRARAGGLAVQLIVCQYNQP